MEQAEDKKALKKTKVKKKKEDKAVKRNNNYLHIAGKEGKAY